MFALREALGFSAWLLNQTLAMLGSRIPSTFTHVLLPHQSIGLAVPATKRLTMQNSERKN